MSLKIADALLMREAARRMAAGLIRNRETAIKNPGSGLTVPDLAPGTSGFTSSVLLVILYAMNPRISMDPSICHGKPVIRGTRVLVSTILGALAGGDSMEQIQQDYQIVKEDIAAALEFAKEASDCQISVYEAVA